MSETSSEDFSDSDSDVSQDEEPEKTVENGKRKVLEKKSKAKNTEDSNDSSDDQESAPQPVKKRKTLQDYLNEKVN